MVLPALDFQTAFAMTALLAWSLMAVFWVLAREFWSQGVPQAIVGVFSLGAAYACLSLQGVLPRYAMMSAAHVWIALAIAFMTLSYRRFGLLPQGFVDRAVLFLPLAAFALVGWLVSDFITQVRWRGAVFVVQMLVEIAVLLRIRHTSPGRGVVLVLAAQIVQVLSLVPLMLAPERPAPIDLEVSTLSLLTLMPWVICLVMFLNLQTTGIGYLLMLKDRNDAQERAAAALDGLTRLASRRTFVEHVPRAMQQAWEADEPLGVLVLDIDHFKRVNDEHGHLAGDAVIQEVARRLAQEVREEDFVARYGGEEFVVLLPAATPAILQTVAERVAQAMRATPMLLSGNEQALRITVSLGGHVQQVTPDVRWEELLAAADAALYEAKHAGRDRVMLSPLNRAALQSATNQAPWTPGRHRAD